MLFRQADNTDPESWSSRLRLRRMKLFLDLAQTFTPPVKVLDVGGTVRFWEQAGVTKLEAIDLTLLNLVAVPTGGAPHVHSVVGDARDLSAFPDRAFDICMSNSVIEHVGTFYDQRAMADEISRVSVAYFVQTPNRTFPLEAHFHVPFWPFLPLSVRSKLHQWMKLGWIEREPDPVLARADVEQIRLLTRQEVAYLFPDGTILEERVCGLTKSFFAVRRPGE
jgi:hypothetical protein